MYYNKAGVCDEEINEADIESAGSALLQEFGLKIPESFPKEGYILMRPTFIRNQGSISDCVAQTEDRCLVMENMNQRYVPGGFAIGWMYGRHLESGYNLRGMVPSDMLHGMRTIGAPLHTTFPQRGEVPYIIDLVRRIGRTPAIMAEAARHTYEKTISVDSNHDIKVALMNNRPVRFTMAVSNAFRRIGPDGIYNGTRTNQWNSSYGLHMMTLVGWTYINGKEYWVVDNSWGQFWGNRGTCFISTDRQQAPRARGYISLGNTPQDESNLLKTIQFTTRGGLCDTVLLDGTRFTLPTPIFMHGERHNERIHVPLRFIKEMFGGEVEWYDSNFDPSFNQEQSRIRRITITKGNTVVVMHIGEREYFINGIKHEMDVAPLLARDANDVYRTMVSVRFIAEAFGHQVDWDDRTYTATITRAA